MTVFYDSQWHASSMLKLEAVSDSYRKNSKIWDTSNNCHNCPKNRKVWCNIALMHPKDADGMANSVHPDQTASSEAVWSWSALFAGTYLSQYIEFVRYLFSGFISVQLEIGLEWKCHCFKEHICKIGEENFIHYFIQTWKRETVISLP